MANYRVLDVDLTSARDRSVLFQRDTQIANVVILEFTAGTDFQLHFGQSPAIPIKAQGEEWRLCPAENDGVFMTHGAQPGLSVKLLVSFGSAPLTLQGVS